MKKLAQIIAPAFIAGCLTLFGLAAAAQGTCPQGYYQCGTNLCCPG